MILLFDGNNLIFKSYFAIKEIQTSKGVPTNALYGVLKSFRSTVQEFKPDYVIMCWDSGKKTFRHEQYQQYKANRDPVQNNLKLQFPIVQEAFDILGVPQLTAQGVECDDLIGTIAKKASSVDKKTIIVSSDKDFYQLCDENISIFSSTVKKKGGTGIVDIEYVRKNFEVEPSQLVDIKSLTGEKTDNIQGVKGIGPKIATNLIKRHNTVFDVIKILKNNRIISDRYKPILESIDIIKNAYKLAKIKTDVKLPEISIVPVESIKINEEELIRFFENYEMKQFNMELHSWLNLFKYKITLV
jgi:DNA polymerase-1